MVAMLVSNDFINLLLTRIHWSTGIIWFCHLYYYSIVFIENVNPDSVFGLIKHNFKAKLIFVISIIWFLAFVFIPIQKTEIPINYFPGLGAWFITFYCIIHE